MSPYSKFPILWIFASAAALALLCAVFMGRRFEQRWPLAMFAALAGGGDAIPLIAGRLWTPEFAVVSIVADSLAAVAVILTIARRVVEPRAAAWLRVLGASSLVGCGALAAYGLEETVVLRSAYRGIFVLQAVVLCLVSSLVVVREWWELSSGSVDRAVLNWFLLVFVARTVYLAGWELAPLRVVNALAIVSTVSWVAALLAITVAVATENQSR